MRFTLILAALVFSQSAIFAQSPSPSLSPLSPITVSSSPTATPSPKPTAPASPDPITTPVSAPASTPASPVTTPTPASTDTPSPAVSTSPTPQAPPAAFSWETAIIRMEVTSKAFDPGQPWVEGQRQGLKFGVVIDGHNILTTAEGLENNTQIRLQKGGGGFYSIGQIAWIDYQTNIALISCIDPDFWDGLTPAKMCVTEPTSGPVQIMRWSDVDLENRKGAIDRIHVVNSDLSSVSVPALRIVDTNIQSAGLSEAVAQGDTLVGIGNAQEGDTLDAIPASFINKIVTDHGQDKYTGIGYFDFTWDPVQNPLNLEYLRVPPPARGVIVRDTQLKPGFDEPLKRGDVILKIDSYDIDAQGNYNDPLYGKLCLENLSCRDKWSGGVSQMKIIRDGKAMDISYTLPKSDFADGLVPLQSYDKPPYYVMVAGLVFIPLTDEYLRSAGNNWRVQAPLDLEPYLSGKITPERPERVILSRVWPAEINMTYESAQNEVVDKVNGIAIKDLKGLVEALKTPLNGYDVIDFEGGSGVHRVVLPAEDIDKANDAIQQNYNIPRVSVLPGDDY